MKGRFYALLLAALPLAASAGDEVGHWYVAPYGGGISPGNQWDGNSTFLGGLAFGNHFSEDWSAELNFNSARLATDNHQNHTRLSALSLDLLRVFNRSGVFAPYLDIGAGDLRAQTPATPTSDAFMLEGGAGAFIKLWENGDASRSFSLRPDVKV
ncbi:MAG TPA: outer membrane beta-barrel protein, partial [Steroidobacteraceae bacterium]|nr:outer membrane beta-barrel protein [Steroidobacteraceae bacterium]